MKIRVLTLICALVTLLLVVGCGSSSTQNAGNNGNTPSASGTTPGAGGTGGIGSTAAIQLDAETNDHTSQSPGHLTLDTSGKGVLTMHDNGGMAGVAVTWCNFPGTTGCFNIATFSGDANGNVNGSFTFPNHGNFAGQFGLAVGNTDFFTSGWNIPNGSTPFSSTLLRASTITAGLGSSGTVGSDPLASGVVSIAASSSIVHVEVHGASPSTAYTVALCFMGSGGGCQTFGSLTTNASGDASADFPWSSSGLFPGIDFSGVFVIRRTNGEIEFVNGFHVP